MTAVRAIHGALIEWKRLHGEPPHEMIGRGLSDAKYIVSPVHQRLGRWAYYWELRHNFLGIIEVAPKVYGSADQAMVDAEKIEASLAPPPTSRVVPAFGHAQTSARHTESAHSQLARVERMIEHHAAEHGQGRYQWDSAHPLGSGRFRYFASTRPGVPSKTYVVTMRELETSWKDSGHPNGVPSGLTAPGRARRSVALPPGTPGGFPPASRPLVMDPGFWAMRHDGKPAAGPFTAHHLALPVAQALGGYVQYVPLRKTKSRLRRSGKT